MMVSPVDYFVTFQDEDTSKDKDTTLDGSEPDSDEGAHSEGQHSEKAGPDITITMTADSDHSSDYSRSGSAKVGCHGTILIVRLKL